MEADWGRETLWLERLSFFCQYFIANYPIFIGKLTNQIPPPPAKQKLCHLKRYANLSPIWTKCMPDRRMHSWMHCLKMMNAVCRQWLPFNEFLRRKAAEATATLCWATPTTMCQHCLHRRTFWHFRCCTKSILTRWWGTKNWNFFTISK